MLVLTTSMLVVGDRVLRAKNNRPCRWVIIVPDGTIVYAYHRLCKMLGTQEPELLLDEEIIRRIHESKV